MLYNEKYTSGMDRYEWLAHRRNGIGGSDAGAIMGANPWKSAFGVWCDKSGKTKEIETSEAMRQGIDLEEYVAKRFCETTGAKVRRKNAILTRTDYPFMMANVDRLIIGEDAGLECKTTNAFNNGTYKKGEVPPHYIWQCMHYMAVTGLSRWYIAVLVLGREFYVFQIDRDEALISRLIEAEHDFWHNHVLAGNPPLPTGSDNDAELISELSKSGDAPGKDEYIDLEHIRGELDKLAEFKDLKDEAEMRYESVRQLVKLAMGAYSVGKCTGYKITNKEQTRETLDTKKLKEFDSELYQKYAKKQTTRVLLVKGDSGLA